LHDWTSHGADAFRTFAAGWAEPELKKTADRWGDGYRSPSRSQSWTVA
jgi:hypothetical protein